MSKSRITLRVVLMMCCATLLTLVMVVGTLFWFAQQSDHRAQHAAEVVINEHLDLAVAQLRADAQGFARWPRASRAAGAQNTAWLTGRLTALLRSQDVSFAVVHWPQDDRFIALSENTGESLRLDLLPPETINALSERVDAPTAADGSALPQFIEASTGLHIVTVHGIAAYDAVTPTANLLLGRRVDAALFYNALAHDVNFTTPVTPVPDNALLLKDIFGNALATVVWRPDAPGSALIDRALLPLGLAMILFLALSAAIMRAARRGVNALVASEARSTAAARSDALTGLPNRMHFGECVAQLEEKKAQEIAVVVLDINGFKRINDSAGHAAGDELVQTLASRLQSVLPKKGFLARVGGDEFRVLFSGENAAAYLEHFLMHVEEVCNSALHIQDHTFQVNFAVGYAAGNTEEVEASEIVRRADLAMYEAKNLRSGTPVGFHDGIMQDQGQKQVIENALRASLQSPEDFQIFYQPIICASSGKMHRAEALLRWKSATLGRVSPERFIPIAESSGLIIALGKLIMKRVCADLSTWNDLRVSVNLSPVQLLDPNFLDDTDRIIRTANVAPNRIEFELTEGLVVDDPDRAAKILKSLRAQGHTISLDDFGTGFSSIGYLRRMSFDKLKVDKRFVSELGGSQKANELLKSLQLLSRSMNLTIVAEGVETETQYETLYELGYDYVQGYYSGRAMPFDDLFSIFPGRNMMERDEEMAQSA